jgi:hypothetical protein
MPSHRPRRRRDAAGSERVEGLVARNILIVKRLQRIRRESANRSGDFHEQVIGVSEYIPAIDGPDPQPPGSPPGGESG